MITKEMYEEFRKIGKFVDDKVEEVFREMFKEKHQKEFEGDIKSFSFEEEGCVIVEFFDFDCDIYDLVIPDAYMTSENWKELLAADIDAEKKASLERHQKILEERAKELNEKLAEDERQLYEFYLELKAKYETKS